MATHTIQVTVNGTAHEAAGGIAPAARPLPARELRLTGTHIGCDTTHCGACTVLARRRAGEVVHRARRAGRRPRGHDRRGLEQDGKLHPIQEGFWQEHGLQCGFCTPGMMMTSAALLEAQREPERGRDPPGDLGQPVPLHRLRQHREGDPVRGREAAAVEGGDTMATQRTTPEVGGMGHSIKRKEDPRFIRGQGNYVDDIQLPGMLYLDIVRSPFAHAQDQDDQHRARAEGARRARRHHRRDAGAVQPPLDADADVGHPDGAADREGDVPGAGGGGASSPPTATPPPTAWTRWRWTTTRCRWSSIRSRRSSPARRCCGPTRRTRRTTTSSTGRWATGQATDQAFAERRTSP